MHRFIVPVGRMHHPPGSPFDSSTCHVPESPSLYFDFDFESGHLSSFSMLRVNRKLEGTVDDSQIPKVLEIQQASPEKPGVHVTQ
jgi:hypothetical protein